MFIKGAETAARSGKMAYVSREYHDRIMLITRVIGKDKLTLSAYLDLSLIHIYAINITV